MAQNKTNLVAKMWMDLAPLLMRRMRQNVMESSVSTLTMPQYRILANINRGLNSIGAIAEHHGVAQPSMSKMINLMVKRGLIIRKTLATDKRQSVLSLSKKGEQLFFKVRALAQRRFSEKLLKLSTDDLRVLETSFAEIRQVLEKWK